MSIPKMHLTTEARMVRLVRYMTTTRTIGRKEGVARFGATAFYRALHAGILRRVTGSYPARYTRGHRFEQVLRELEAKVEENEMLKEAVHYV